MSDKGIGVGECPQHGEYNMDTKDSPCPACEDLDSDDICPNTLTAHEPDWDNVHSTSSGGVIYIDVHCRHCGRHGCVGSQKALEEGISW